MKLTLVTYNIHMGLKPDMFAKNLKEFAAEGVGIFCLQEFWRWMQPVDLEKLFLDILGTQWKIKYEDTKAPHHDYGSCILWNSDVLKNISFEKIALPLVPKLRIFEKMFIRMKGFGPEAYIVQRGALIGDFIWQNNHLRITNIHFDWAGGMRQRLAQVLYLKKHLANRELADFEIICGDFNTNRIITKKKEIAILENAAGDGMKNIRPDQQITCWPFSTDQIFVKNMEMINLKINRIPGSDHFPLSVTVMGNR